MPWFGLREFLLTVLHTPAMLLPLAAVVGVALATMLHLRGASRAAVAVAAPILVSLLYSPAATLALTGWLQGQLPPAPAPSGAGAVAVLVGRGPAIAAATTAAASRQFASGRVVAAYVSGDQRATADSLLRLGVPEDRIAGDSCARTTWENATLTAAWLRQHHPGAPVLLITDTWQLPRAVRAFQHQGLAVQSLAATALLSAAEQNRLALREAAATALYRLQGRM